MLLYVDGERIAGNVENYTQRGDGWEFTTENGLSIYIKFDNIHTFDSCGRLVIYTEYAYQKKNSGR